MLRVSMDRVNLLSTRPFLSLFEVLGKDERARYAVVNLYLLNILCVVLMVFYFVLQKRSPSRSLDCRNSTIRVLQRFVFAFAALAFIRHKALRQPKASDANSSC